MLLASSYLEAFGEYGIGSNGFSTSASSLWNIGFGEINPTSLIAPGGSLTDTLSVVANILLANSAQVILSFLYLYYNNIFTCELLNQEWTSYTQKRKSLRVTDPAGAQCSTYFLQLPYTYAMPLMAFSGLLHWLVSQSIFLAQVNYYDEQGENNDRYVISTCGYSCIAIVLALVVGSLLVVGSWVNSFRRYPGNIPLATTGSAAISAACHPPKDDVDAAFKEVQYGEIGRLDGFRHCTFTSHEVSTPISGELYL
ncbi:hypothetical protein MMC25_002046 [Agyrium rufum]|nr:hypothetical protein [Agyrium rufum]